MNGEMSKVDRDYLVEMARILGTDVITKEAAAKNPEGIPGADKKLMAMKLPKKVKGGKLSKIASMSLREIMEDENFRRGVFEEIETSRPVWEPLIRSMMQG